MQITTKSMKSDDSVKDFTNVLETDSVDIILSDDERRVFEIVNFVIVSSLVSLFGIVANIVNILIFYNQGFNNTVNICFFGLAVSDVCCLISLEWITICMNPLFAKSDIPWISSEVMYLTGAWLHVCFGRITSYITVYITAERCLSIAIPLKVKQIITPARTTIALILIYVMNLMTLVSEYATSYLDWKFIPEVNRTLLAMIFTGSRENVEGLVSVLHSVIGMASFAGVVIFTAILINRLRQTSKWRKKATSEKRQNESISTREKKTVMMIVLIASFLIACYTPGAIIVMTTFIVGPEFNIKGRYVNLCMSTWSVACSFHSINSSVNIFLYYKMSSKYRQTFHEMFIICVPKRVTG